MFLKLHGGVLSFRPHELDFKYVMKVSSLKKRLPEAAFRKQNYLEQKGLFRCNDTLHALGSSSYFPFISVTRTHVHTPLWFCPKWFAEWPLVKVVGLLCDVVPWRLTRNWKVVSSKVAETSFTIGRWGSQAERCLQRVGNSYLYLSRRTEVLWW